MGFRRPAGGDSLHSRVSRVARARACLHSMGDCVCVRVRVRVCFRAGGFPQPDVQALRGLDGNRPRPGPSPQTLMVCTWTAHTSSSAHMLRPPPPHTHTPANPSPPSLPPILTPPRRPRAPPPRAPGPSGVPVLTPGRPVAARGGGRSGPTPFRAASQQQNGFAGGGGTPLASSMPAWKQMRAFFVFAVLAVGVLHQLYLTKELEAVKRGGTAALGGLAAAVLGSRGK